jgi:hypothetical protein
MPNAIAYLALVLWPVASVVLFRLLPTGRALIASLLIGYLFLPPPPAGFDFPLLPPFTKETIPSIVAVLICLFIVPDKVELIPSNKAARVLMALFVFSPVLTVLTNLDPVSYGAFGLPALRFYDALAIMVQQTILLMPFLLARTLLRSPESQRDILWAFVIGGLVYSVPMLIEIRLSPQLNIWIYGYFQHNFDQMIRFGGFRPIVFLYHGIWVAFFAMTAVLAAVTLARADHSRRSLAIWLAAFYILAVLILSKSLAGILYAIAFLPVFAILSTRWQLNLAIALTFLAVAYPVMKGAQVVPETQILAAAGAIQEDRAASLDFRFDNERVLLDRAFERPLFGWGSWGRNQLYDGNTGAPLTVADGRWIILIGIYGWVGFLAEFGLLTLPMFIFWWRSRNSDIGELPPWTVPLALLLAINIIDLIPNATLTPLTWMMSGALLGFAERYSPSKRRVLDPIRTVL